MNRKNILLDDNFFQVDLEHLKKYQNQYDSFIINFPDFSSKNHKALLFNLLDALENEGKIRKEADKIAAIEIFRKTETISVEIETQVTARNQTASGDSEILTAINKQNERIEKLEKIVENFIASQKEILPVADEKKTEEIINNNEMSQIETT